MREAARHPGQAVESNLDNLGLCDMDQYDWVGQSPNAETISAACQWLKDQVKESPHDDVQILPEADYRKLKGEQRKVFLQVMAYFKKIRSRWSKASSSPYQCGWYCWNWKNLLDLGYFTCS
jgi:hypothetical protein